MRIAALVLWLSATLLTAAEPAPRVIKSLDKPYPSFGKIERKDARLDKLLPADAKLKGEMRAAAKTVIDEWMQQAGPEAQRALTAIRR